MPTPNTRRLLRFRLDSMSLRTTGPPPLHGLAMAYDASGAETRGTASPVFRQVRRRDPPEGCGDRATPPGGLDAGRPIRKRMKCANCADLPLRCGDGRDVGSLA